MSDHTRSGDRRIEELERENRLLRQQLAECKTVSDQLTGNRAALGMDDPLVRAQRFQEALDRVPAYIYMKDLQSRYVYANKPTLELFGCTAEELVGRADASFFPPGTVERLKEIDLRVFGGHDTQEEIDLGDSPDRRVYWEVKTPIYEDAERTKIWGLCGISTDITDRKRMEEDLRAASLYARSLIEASPDPLVTISPEGKITDVNEATVKVTGLTREALTGTDFCDYFTEPAQAREGYREAFEKGSVTDYPLTIRRRDGCLTDVLYNASVYRDSHGRVLGVFAAARDITALKRATETVVRNERLLRTILENLPVGVILFDRNGHVVEHNPAVLGIWGDLPHVGIEQYREYKGWWADTGRLITPHEWASARAVERGEVSINELIDIEGFDGVRRTVFNSAVPVRDDNGAIAGAVVVLQDVTETRQAEQALRDLNARLEQSMAELVATQQQVIQSEKLAALGRLAAGVAHELNNPLMGVMGYVGLSQRREENPELKEILANAFHELERMRDLIRNLLGFARPVVEGELILVSIPATLERAFALLQPGFASHGISVTTEVAADLPMVLAKSNELQQVFLNVLINARDAVEECPVREIRISAHRTTEARVAIEISDSGPGIPSAIQGQIFDPFFTTKPPGKGTGLGLSIARNIMTDLGGVLTVRSHVGEGATFTMELPLPRGDR